MPNIDRGCIVRLNSGGPLMLVLARVGERAVCMWPDGSDDFPAAGFTLVIAAGS